MDRELPVPHEGPNKHGLMPSWGYEVLVEDQGFKGLIVIRLMPMARMSPEDSGHPAELHENIVVFRKD
ncbi:MAG TPA: hypothetical protein VFS19_06565 [Planctomycetota bacterium]|nr:hypothetical protein [Planctomycetota bacterium]